MSHLLALVVGVVGILGQGCRSTPELGYPIGLYAVPEVGDFPKLREAGFNVVVGRATSEYLAAAASAGMQVLAAPGTMVGTAPFDCHRAREVIRRWDAHPALWGWYLSDEPDLHRVDPEAVRAAGRCVKSTGARKPTALALYHGREAELYAPYVDRVLIDRYPIPWLPLADFPKHLRLARLAAGPGKPVYAVIQAFDWSHFPDLSPLEGRGRTPTHAEIRAMTFLALVEGMHGVFFYSFKEPNWSLESNPETWEALKRVVAEVRELEPLFEARPEWRQVRVQHADPATRRNAALDPSVQAALVRVNQGSERVPVGDYWVAVNTLDTQVVWEFALPEPAGERVPRLVGGGVAVAWEGWFVEALGPYEVQVYGPF